jgi:hypothetical protein
MEIFGDLAFYAVPIIILLAIIASAIKILREYERGVVFTLGRFTGVKGPGLILLVPFVQQMVRVDLRTLVLDVPTQDVISRDNVSVQVNAVIYFRVIDPEKATIQVEDFMMATTALATGAFFLSFLLKQYWAAPLAIAVVVALFLSWTRRTGLSADSGPIPVGWGKFAVPHVEAKSAPSFWAMIFTLTADATFYASLLFGALFLWVSAPNWPPPQIAQPNWLLMAMSLLALAVAWATGRRALAINAVGSSPVVPLAAGAAANIAASALLLWLASEIFAERTAHAYSATGFAVLIYVALHSGLGAVVALYGLRRAQNGYVSAQRSLDLRIGRLWHDYTAAAGVVALVFLLLMMQFPMRTVSP